MPDYFESGMFTRKPAWHGKGNVLEEPPASWMEARIAAGMTWDVTTAPVYVQRHGETEELPGWQEIIRSDTGATLHVSKESYALVTHHDMGEIIDAVTEGSEYHIESLVSVYEGRLVAALLEYAEPIQLTGDPSAIKRYVAVINAHDQRSSLEIAATNVRVVCANTVTAAEMDAARSNTLYRFHHTKNWRQRFKEEIQQARAAIKASKLTDLFVAEAEDLLRLPVSKAQMEEFLELFMPLPKDSLVSPKVQRNLEEARDQVRVILGSHTCHGIEGSAYWLVQGAGEYLDHGRDYKSNDTYVNRTLLSVEALKLRAVRCARKVAGSPRPSDKVTVLT